MKRITYKGFIIDRDNLGRLYIYNTRSPYAEDSDRNYGCGNSIKTAKEAINYLLSLSEETWESLNEETWYFLNDPADVDEIFGSEYPTCISANEIRRLSREWDTDLMSKFHEATEAEIAEYGVSEE